MTDETEPRRLETEEFSASTAPRRAARVGRYRIIQPLGEGGMGEVFEAEQEEPVRRRVALKLIKPGMDTKQVVARFESERQALALMDHPNIAHVYDAGTTEDGRPYFAMEFVQGIPITQYCDKVRMTNRERLELLIRVCEGVQHAHQKGIIHRDIKPSNVLVSIQDDRPVPKIIDFGIAKATAQRLTERTMFTEMGQLVGTPEYMSPEQAEMGGLDVDTRTDVYSLGVLLYELLAGELPFPPLELRRGGFNELRRKILEEEPPKPSTRLNAQSSETQDRADHRRTDVPSLKRQLRGDLDWITLKALEKDRTRRYASASELAADVARYLNNEPVLASPPSNVYRIRKFMRRHKAGTTFAAVLLALLAGFGVTMKFQKDAVALERDRAEQEKQRANIEAERASHESRTAGRVVDYLVDLFGISDPNKTLGREISARDLLDRGVESIGELEDEPIVQARLMHTMGRVYGTHGLFKTARTLLEDALELREELLDDEHPDVAETMDLLAGTLVRLGEYEKALAYYERALAIRRNTLDPDHPDLASSLNNMGNILGLLEHNDDADKFHMEALEIRRKSLDPDNPELAKSLNNIATMRMSAGNAEGARELYEQALTMYQNSYSPGHPKVATVHVALADALRRIGKYADAKHHYDLALQIREQVYGPEHHDVGRSLIALALFQVHVENFKEGAALYDRAVSVFGRTGSLDNPLILYDQARYAAMIGDRAEALRKLSLALADRTFISRARNDPDLASLHGDREFEIIVTAAQSRPKR